MQQKILFLINKYNIELLLITMLQVSLYFVKPVNRVINRLLHGKIYITLESALDSISALGLRLGLISSLGQISRVI